VRSCLGRLGTEPSGVRDCRLLGSQALGRALETAFSRPLQSRKRAGRGTAGREHRDWEGKLNHHPPGQHMQPHQSAQGGPIRRGVKRCDAGGSEQVRAKGPTRQRGCCDDCPPDDRRGEVSSVRSTGNRLAKRRRGPSRALAGGIPRRISPRASNCSGPLGPRRGSGLPAAGKRTRGWSARSLRACWSRRGHGASADRRRGERGREPGRWKDGSQRAFVCAAPGGGERDGDTASISLPKQSPGRRRARAKWGKGGTSR